MTILNKYLPLSRFLSYSSSIYTHHFHLKLLFDSRDIGECIFVETAMIRSPCMIKRYVMSNGGNLVVDLCIRDVGYVLK
jgi:hypothetical protein